MKFFRSPLVLITLALFAACNSSKQSENSQKAEKQQILEDSASAYILQNHPEVQLSDSSKWSEFEFWEAYKDGEGFKEYWIFVTTPVKQQLVQEPSEEAFMQFMTKVESGELPPDATPPQPSITDVVTEHKIKVKLDTNFSVTEVSIPPPPQP